MWVDVLKGLLVGFCAAVPLGPIAILVVQKTLNKGRVAGFITGMGGCVVDTIYALVAIFALAMVQQFVADHRELILLIGGVVLMILGLSMSLSNPIKRLRSGRASSYSVKDFLQSMLMGFTNPGAVFVILTLFAFFGIAEDSPHNWSVAPIVLAVSAGEAFYWFLFTGMLNRFRDRFRLRAIIWVNRVTGAIVILIGVALLGEGLFRVIFEGATIQ